MAAAGGAGSGLHNRRMTDATTDASFLIRAAEPRDLADIVRLIGRLAEFEHLEHLVQATPEALGPHLFGPRPVAEALVVDSGERVVAFALFFTNFSTFLARPGLYLEDLFVVPDARRFGMGRAFFHALAEEALRRGCGRMEWVVLDWNQLAIDFYEKLGARRMTEWYTYRLSADQLREIAGAESGR